jgi:hypothetical protein
VAVSELAAVTDVKATIGTERLTDAEGGDSELLLRAGKKRYCRIIVK